ncbi:MAG: dihydroorotate dehydrogenase (quinone) [Alphaproteobacteria bacterium]|nr:dihydroorotate dehydrogenase (quinone) [Alphaproteobacteria bacterium]
MKVPRYGKANLSNMLFTAFWWISHKISPSLSKKLIVYGIRDGAFADRRIFNKVLGIDVMGYHFKNPIGVAAGLDKRGNVIDGMIALGYGFGEFGSYTLEKEMPFKKVMYLRQDKAILMQSLGYRNPGVQAIIPSLISRRHLPNFVGVNITTSTPTESENIKQGQHMTYEHEFALMASKVAPYCDYLVLNFAHPEVELSRLMTDRATVVPIVRSVRTAISQAAPIRPPKIVIKLPLDLTPHEVPLVCNALMEAQVDAVIVGGVQSLSKGNGNTLKDKKYHHIGMLAGKPIKDLSTALVANIYQHTQGKLPIIACGGVFNGKDAYEKIAAGASLIQIYSAILFQGPNVVNKINRELTKILLDKGFQKLEDAVGCEMR